MSTFDSDITFSKEREDFEAKRLKQLRDEIIRMKLTRSYWRRINRWGGEYAYPKCKARYVLLALGTLCFMGCVSVDTVKPGAFSDMELQSIVEDIQAGKPVIR